MTTYVRTQHIEHALGERGELGIRVTNADVDVVGVEGDVVRAEATFDIRASSDTEAEQVLERAQLVVEQGPGRLEIAEPRDGPAGLGSLARLLTGGGRVERSLRIEVPIGCTLTYTGVSGDLTAIDLRGTQAYRTVSGDLVLERLGGEVRVKGVSGDVSLRAEEPLTLVEINTVSGDISAIAPRIGLLRIVTVSGDVELEGVLDDGPVHRIDTTSGDLSMGVPGDLSLEVRGLSSDADIRLPHRAEGSRDRRRYIIGTGGPSLLFSSMSGDVEIRAPWRIERPATPPSPPTPPTPQTPPTPPTAPTPRTPATAAPSAAAGTPSADAAVELEVLRALERGEIDVDEAARRLAAGGRRDA